MRTQVYTVSLNPKPYVNNERCLVREGFSVIDGCLSCALWLDCFDLQPCLVSNNRNKSKKNENNSNTLTSIPGRRKRGPMKNPM